MKVEVVLPQRRNWGAGRRQCRCGLSQSSIKQHNTTVGARHREQHRDNEGLALRCCWLALISSSKDCSRRLCSHRPPVFQRPQRSRLIERRYEQGHRCRFRFDSERAYPGRVATRSRRLAEASSPGPGQARAMPANFGLRAGEALETVDLELLACSFRKVLPRHL